MWYPRIKAEPIMGGLMKGGADMKRVWITAREQYGRLRAFLPFSGRRFRRTCDNMAHNEKLFSACKDRFLNGQRTEPLSAMRYGTYPLSWNGCELIACYNAAAYLGIKISFPQVVHEFELNRMHYLFPNGYWGTAPKKLWYFFARHGMEYRCWRDGGRFAAEAATGVPSCGIISFWNNKRSTAKLHGLDFFSGGLHTVFYEYKGGKFRVYNLYGSDTKPRVLDSIADAYREKRFIIGYLFMKDSRK